MANKNEIPTVDLADLTSDHNKQDAAKRLGQAFAEHGFVYITNHGLEELCNKSLDKVQEFFKLPQEKKDEIHKADSYRGYFRFREEQSNYKDDWKEGIYFFNEKLNIQRDTPESIFSGSNPWPSKENVPGFKEVVSECFRKMLELGYHLMDGLSLSLGLSEDFFSKKFSSEPFAQLATFHYFPSGQSSAAEQLWGTGEHTDYGTVTVLLQDGVGGLQAKTRDGEWVDVPPVPGSLVVNLGDMLEIWTNGVFKAPPHQVKASPTEHRFSVAMFLEPSLDCIISPISVDNALFPVKQTGTKHKSVKLPLRYGDYVLDKYRKNIPSVEKYVKQG